MGLDDKTFASIIRGDRGAFENLFQKYYNLLCNYASTYVDDIVEVEDVVQDVFVYVWHNRKKISVTTSVKAYLYTSVKHRALNILKRQAMERSHSHLLIEFLEDLAKEEYSEEEVTQLKQIRLAIKTLPPQCRTIFMMSCIDGKKYKEISEELNISINTVKTHMSKAYREIREYLEDNTLSSLLFFCMYKDLYTLEKQ